MSTTSRPVGRWPPCAAGWRRCGPSTWTTATRHRPGWRRCAWPWRAPSGTSVTGRGPRHRWPWRSCAPCRGRCPPVPPAPTTGPCSCSATAPACAPGSSPASRPTRCGPSAPGCGSTSPADRWSSRSARPPSCARCGPGPSGDAPPGSTAAPRSGRWTVTVTSASARSRRRASRVSSRRAAAGAALDPTRYRGLSLRRGTVAAATEHGASDAGIMAHTGHRSRRLVRRYMADG